MAYTLSLDVSLKLRGCDIKGFLNHFFREDEDTKQHSNENIHTDLSHNNMTLVYNAETGRMEPATSREQILDAINNRLSDAIDLESGTYRNNGRTVRKDAVQCRGMILQLDPEFYKDNKDNPNAVMKSYDDLLRLAKKRYGKENIVAASVHLDETNPHMHILFTPVTADNRLSQKDFFDKKKLKEAHKEMREELRSKGYDIDMGRRTPKGAKRMTEEEYKAFKDAAKKAKELAEKEQQLEADRQHNLRLQQQVRQMASEASEKISEADNREQRLEAQKAEFEAYRASESQRLEEENQHSRQLEQQATSKLEEAEELYNKSKELHSKLMNMSDVFTEKFADDFARELGYTKKNIRKGLSM